MAIRRLAPEPSTWFFSERMTTFAAEKDEYNVVFVGSSHYRSALDPALFDQLTAEADRPMKSFNFGLPGIRLHEINYVVRRIGELEPANLDWVFIEPWFQVQLKEANLKKHRLIYYHDPTATLLALRCIRHQPPPKEGRLHHYQQILQHSAYWQTNQGLALSLIRDFYQGNSPARTRLMNRVTEGRGYYKREGSSFYQAEQQRYEKQVAELPSLFRQEPLEPEVARLLTPTLREVEAMGARPVILFGPSVSTPFDLVLPDEAPHADIVRLDDIGRYPELFALKNRWDMGHLNNRGARLATRATAEAFLEIATGKEGD